MLMRQEKWKNASRSNRNLSEVRLLSGRLTAGQATAAESLRLAELADDAEKRCYSHAYRAHAHALRGEVPAALSAFRAALDWQHKAEGDNDRPLWSLPGIWHTHLLARLGRRDEATRLTEANLTILEPWGPDDPDKARCNLIFSDLHREAGDLARAEALRASAHDWAVARDAREVLCWSALVQARIALARSTGVPPVIPSEDNHTPNPASRAGSPCYDALTDGLKIARDCGYGLYHIDLLLVRARLHLHSGEPEAALDDLRTALDVSVPADEQTGQPELLAATHAECGYSWAIAEGFSLRGEALLLKAAQTLGQSTFVPARRATLPAPVRDLLTHAESCLTESLARWQPLHDPEPERPDQNFHLDGQPCNHRAAETHRILIDLKGGALTNYPLHALKPTEPSETDTMTEPKGNKMSKRFAVALSFPGEHRSYVQAIADALAASLTKPRVFYDRYYEAELSRPNLDTCLQKIYHDDSELVVVVLCKEYDEKDWCGLEFRAIRDLIKKRRDDEIMFVRVADGDVKGVFEIDGYVDAKNRPATEIAQVIRDRLALLQSPNP